MHPLFQSMSLADVCTKITDGSHYSPKSVEFGFCMASVKDLTEFGINLSTCRRISKEDFLELVHQGCKPEVNDILIAKDGNSCLDTVCLHTIEQEVVLLSSVAILRPDTSIINPKYLALYLSDSRIKSEMKDTLVSGSAIPRVVLRSFKDFKVAVPPLPVQYRIADILGSLDDKIELNRRMNETLEQMAMALYKHWFVDFGPFQDGEFVESELGMIPKGWEVGVVGDIYHTSSGGTPSRKRAEYYDGGTINWLKTKELDDGFIFSTEEKITKVGLANSSAKVFSRRTVVMAMYGATVGKLGILANESSTNQACCALWGTKTYYSSEFIFLYLLFNRSEIINQAIGGAQQNISQQVIRGLKMIIPPYFVLDKITPLLKELYLMIENNDDTIRSLNEVRDYLLPRLLSGEINLDIVEDHVLEVMSDVNAPIRV